MVQAVYLHDPLLPGRLQFTLSRCWGAYVSLWRGLERPGNSPWEVAIEPRRGLGSACLTKAGNREGQENARARQSVSKPGRHILKVRSWQVVLEKSAASVFRAVSIQDAGPYLTR